MNSLGGDLLWRRNWILFVAVLGNVGEHQLSSCQLKRQSDVVDMRKDEVQVIDLAASPKIGGAVSRCAPAEGSVFPLIDQLARSSVVRLVPKPDQFLADPRAAQPVFFAKFAPGCRAQQGNALMAAADTDGCCFEVSQARHVGFRSRPALDHQL